VGFPAVVLGSPRADEDHFFLEAFFFVAFFAVFFAAFLVALAKVLTPTNGEMRNSEKVP
jgi:hypothetical protein